MTAAAETVRELRTRIADLEAELAEWRRQDLHTRSCGEWALREHAVAGLLREADGASANWRGPARLLLELIHHRGLRTRSQLFNVVARREDAGERMVDVYLTRLRSALLRLGYPQAIQNVIGRGWLIERSTAEAICKLLAERLQAAL